MEGILAASGLTWHLPEAVKDEVRYCRQHDPTTPGQTIAVAVDLSAVFASGLLHSCSPQTQKELALFMRYAAIFRSDGEAMCLAIAAERKWTVATDDRRAIRIAQQAGLKVVSCPELLKSWADATHPAQPELCRVLRDIRVLAQFRPNSTMPEYQWWVDELAATNP
jgi:hypothetical protein